MALYYVNNRRQDSADGNHNEVHTSDCYYYKQATDTSYLGSFSRCQDAMVEARKKYPYSADGCKHCCPNCHKG